MRWAVIRDPRFRRPEAGGRNPEAAAAVENGQTLVYELILRTSTTDVTVFSKSRYSLGFAGEGATKHGELVVINTAGDLLDLR